MYKHLKGLILLVFLVSVGNVFAIPMPSQMINKRNKVIKKNKSLRTGDVILISLSCYSCNEIEKETKSSFSHAGVLIVERGQVSVLQAMKRVEKVSLKEFLKQKRKDTKVAIYRPFEFRRNRVSSRTLQRVFQKDFEGLPFDEDYLWENYTLFGQEKMYSSEFVTKFLNRFFKNKIQPSPMKFFKNKEFWNNLYNGSPPSGLPGNSPSYFSSSKKFNLIGIF